MSLFGHVFGLTVLDLRVDTRIWELDGYITYGSDSNLGVDPPVGKSISTNEIIMKFI